MADGAGAPPSPRPRSGLLRRLPFLLLVAAGLFLWRAPFFAQERTLVWQLPSMDAPVREVEVQLWSSPPKEALLKRESWRFSGPAPSDVTHKLSLPQGRYRAHAFLVSRSGQRLRWTGQVEVAGEDTLLVPVR